MNEAPIRVDVDGDHVATIVICRPPNNFLSLEVIEGIAAGLETLDRDPSVRAAVLRSEGKHFCAGADLSPGGRTYTTDDLYTAAARIFRTDTPLVVAVQGAAIGGGLGLALAGDFRIADHRARFSANFARLGLHQGFGLSVTLPRVIGPQGAADMFLSGRRVPGVEAAELGLVDRLVPNDELEATAHAYAAEIAMSAPLAVRSIRRTLRSDLADRVVAAMEHEASEQSRLRETDDFREGAAAMLDRRPPNFQGR